MSRIFYIGHTDLRLFLKKKSAYVWLFLAPLAFIYVFGSVYKASAPGNRLPQVFIANADTNFLGAVFVETLCSRGLETVSLADRKEAALEIRIPDDFTSRVLQRIPTKVQLVKGRSYDEADETIVKLRLLRALVMLNGAIVESATTAPASLTADRLRAGLAARGPVNLNARFAGGHPVPAGFDFSLPSNLLMYLMMNLLLFGGATMAAERREGVIKRLMTSPIRRATVISGKVYGLMLLGLVQIAFFLILGKFIFGVNLGANLPLVALILVVFAWVAASLGVLAGSVLAAEDHVVGICLLVSLLMAALGGCWWPIEIAPPAMQKIALCLPTGWALQALNQLITFGNGFHAILLPLAVLLAFGTVANFLAARFFRC